MSEDKRSFLVYGDIKETLDELSDEQVAQLFRGMVNYFVTGKAPKFTGVLKYVWIPIKQQMDRNTEKYEAKCKKNRENIQAYWDKVKGNERIRAYTNATDIDTDTDTETDTKKDTDTDTTTDTDAALKQRARGGGVDEYDIWKRMTPEDVDAVYNVYPNTGGLLMEEVAADVRNKKKKVDKPVAYILGYAKKVKWDDNADHFKAPWEA